MDAKNNNSKSAKNLIGGIMRVGITDVIGALSKVPNFSTRTDAIGSRWLLSNSQLQQFANILIKDLQEWENKKNGKS